MSAPDDERRRLASTYRELAAEELLRLYEGRVSLSPLAVECLRMELRVRGLDPDSLRATVPKAAGSEDDAPGAGDASLVDAEMPSEEPARIAKRPEAEPGDPEADAEAEPEPPEAAAPAGPMVRCTQCGARNPVIEDLCARCGQPLAESAQHQTMSRRVVDPPPPKPAGTVASASAGLLGVSALVFAAYSLTLPRRLLAVTVAALVIGVAALGAAIALYAAKRRREIAAASSAPN